LVYRKALPQGTIYSESTMIVTWSKGSDEWMPESLLVETLQKVQRHPWWRARARLALAVLRKHGIMPPARVWDVGCGWGVNLLALEAAGYAATGLDVSRQILELINTPNRQLIEADLTKDLFKDSVDAVLVLDVIEHLDDDRDCLRRITELLKPGGLAVVSVPARPDLYSEFDRIQGHRRRYLPESLRAAFVGSGLIVSELFWWGAWMVPILRHSRRRRGCAGADRSQTYAEYLRLPPWPAPLLMKFMFACEETRAMSGKTTTGTSLFAIAEREAFDEGHG
jgi:2-polyprenyl-3-methyl-5-hydroxy-6-metoxy-1,4-benzoquinol methylase